MRSLDDGCRRNVASGPATIASDGAMRCRRSTGGRTMRPPPAERELEILGYVADHAPVSTREVAERFGEPNGLARTTVATLMERLRKKGYLTRRRKEGVY